MVKRLRRWPWLTLQIIVANVAFDESESEMPEGAIAVDFYVDGGSFEAQLADVTGEIADAGDDVNVVLDPTAFEVAGREASRLAVEMADGGLNMYNEMVIVDLDGMAPTFAAFGAVEDAEAISAALNAIVASAELNEPLVAVAVEDQVETEDADDDGQSTKDVTSTGEMQTYDNEALGVSFEYPADWYAEEIFSLFTVVSSVPFDIADESDEGVGMFVTVDLAEDEGTVDEQFAEAMADLESGEAEGVTLLGEPEDILVDGKPAKRMTASIEEEESGQVSRIVLVDNGDSVVSFISFAPLDEWEDSVAILDAIVDSAEIGEPDFDAVGNIFDEVVEDAFDEAFDESGGESVIVPTDITAGEIGIGYTIQAVDDVFVAYSLTGGVNYYFVTQALAMGDITLALIDANGSKRADIDNSSSGGSELLSFTPEEDGEFTLQVGEYSGDPQAFNLQVLEIAEWDSAELSADSDTDHVIELAPSSGAQMLIVIPSDLMDVGISGDSGSPDIDFYVDRGFEGEPELLIIPPSESSDRVVEIWSIDVDGIVEFALVPLDDAFLPSESGIIELYNAETQTLFGQSTLTNQLFFDVSDKSALTLRFSGQAGRELAVRIDPDEELDAVIEFYNDIGALLFDIDDGLSGEPELASIRIETAEVSEYVVSLGGWLGASGDFTGSLFHDPGMTVEIPGQGAVIAPLAADAELRYQCMASGSIPFVASITANIGEVDASLVILDEAGEVVSEVNDNGMGESESVLILEPTEQLYTVVATALEGSASNTTLSISCAE